MKSDLCIAAGLFEPEDKDQRELEDLLKPEEEKVVSDNVLVCAVKNEVIALTDYTALPVVIAAGRGYVWDLCLLDDQILLDCGSEGISSTLTGSILCETSSSAMASLGGRLYHGGKGIWKCEDTTDLFIAKRTFNVDSLCSDGFHLVDAANRSISYSIGRASSNSNGLIRKRPGKVDALAYHNGNLYDGGMYDMVYNTLADNGGVAYRGEGVTALCDFDGDLLDACDGMISETLTNKPVFNFGYRVNAMISVPKDLLRGVL